MTTPPLTLQRSNPNPRRAPHRSFDPAFAHDPQTLFQAVALHKSGEYERAWTLYEKLDTESLKLGKGPHYHARMMHALLWYQRTSRIDYEPAGSGTVLDTLNDIILHRPKWADPRYNAGVILEGLGRIDEAAARFEQAVEIDANYGEAWVNLGNCRLHQGRPADARACFEWAREINPDDPLARYNLVHALALFGEWDAAYEGWEFRYLVPGHLRDHGLPRPVPQWDPAHYVPRLVVTDEQGAGDIIQFARFLPLLAARVGTVSCRCRHRALVPLLEANFPEIRFFGEDVRPPDADAHIPLLSSVARLGVREADVPFRTGYLRAPAPLPRSNRIGICYAGSTTHKRDATRSIGWPVFRRLLDEVEASFVDLTVGRGTVEHPRLETPTLTNYADTANLIASLDLVVTVDTGVLHLAGALGVPVWGMISAAPDFRWQLDRRDSPWYASLELFRQPRVGEWGDVIDAVAARLKGTP